MSVRELIKSEIEKLPENLLEEVLDFMKFLETKRERMLLVKAAQKMSGASFEKVWDNDADAPYDNL